jgi:hypothetical protein
VRDMEAFAPVALFAYRRPTHLAQTLRALRENAEASRTELFVFSDCFKSSVDAADVETVRDTLRGINGFAATHVIYRETNFGLSRNITTGVSTVLAARSRVIVIEDDIVVGPHFLRFMNNALQTYWHTPRVGSICAYCYPVSESLPETYFIRGADCWGWGTWRDRWCYYNSDSRALAAELEMRNLSRVFDFEGAASYTQMLMDQIVGKNDSWAIRWHASCYLRDLLVLYPGRALAENIGRDGTGTHSTAADKAFDVKVSSTPVAVGGIPVEESTSAREAIKRLFIKQKAATSAVMACPASSVRNASAVNQRPRRALSASWLQLLRRLRSSWRGGEASK